MQKVQTNRIRTMLGASLLILAFLVIFLAVIFVTSSSVEVYIIERKLALILIITILVIVIISGSIVYHVYSYKKYTNGTVRDLGFSGFDRNVLISSAKRIEKSLTADEAITFQRLLVQPNRFVESMNERMIPLIHVIESEITQTIILPEDLTPGEYILPLLQRPKDQLGDGISIRNSRGEMVSQMPHVDILAYSLAVLRFWAGSVGKLQTYVSEVEPKVAEAFLAPPNSTEVQRVRSKEFSLEMKTIFSGSQTRSSQHLTAEQRRLQRSHAKFLQMAEELIAHISQSKLIAISYIIDDSDLGKTTYGHRVTFSLYMRNIPLGQLDIRIKTIFERIRENKYRIRTVLPEIVDKLRGWLGIQVHVIQSTLDNANRAKNYHLEIKGPDGTYLGRQEMRSFNGIEIGTDQSFSMSPRRGQQTSHLFVYNGENYGERVYVAHFFERMPGSMAGATWSAAVSTLIILLCAFVSLDLFGEGRGHGTDLVAILFALPVVVVLWAGFEKQQSTIGDVLFARLVKLFTIVLSFTAAYLFLFSPDDEQLRKITWILIIGLSATNALASASTWLLRARVYDYFIRYAEIKHKSKGMNNV